MVYGGEKGYGRRRQLYYYDDPVKNDIQLLSYYINKFKQEKAQGLREPTKGTWTLGFTVVCFSRSCEMKNTCVVLQFAGLHQMRICFLILDYPCGYGRSSRLRLCVAEILLIKKKDVTGFSRTESENMTEIQLLLSQSRNYLCVLSLDEYKGKCSKSKFPKNFWKNHEYQVHSKNY